MPEFAGKGIKCTIVVNRSYPFPSWWPKLCSLSSASHLLARVSDVDAVYFQLREVGNPGRLILIITYFVSLSDSLCDHDVLVFKLWFVVLFQGARGVLSIHCEAPDKAALLGIDYRLNMLDAAMKACSI